MRSSTLIAALAAAAGVNAAGHKHGHAHFHEKKAAEAAAIAERAVAVEAMFSAASSALSKIGAVAAVNNRQDIVLGSSGQTKYTNTITNHGPKSQTVVFWDKPNFTINVDAPALSFTLASGQSEDVGFAEGWSGAMSTIKEGEDTSLIARMGAIAQPWAEFTFNGIYTTFDLTMLPKPNGRRMEIISDRCTSNVTHCVFTCKDANAAFCGESLSYDLTNCAQNSQPGASDGTWDGKNPEGGCMPGANANIKTNIWS